MANESDSNPLVAAKLAHEVRNVLMVIEALASLLLEEMNPGGDAVEIIDDLMNTAARAKRLSERLMQLARSASTDAPADLLAVVARHTETLRRIAPHQIRVELRAGSGPLWTRLSTVEIEQVLFNLAHNAFDAMEPDGVLSLELQTTAGSVVLTVGDTGSGMDEATLQRWFEPFFTTKAARGNGLRAVREAVDQAGGHVSVASTVGKGTTITIHLPLLDRGPAS